MARKLAHENEASGGRTDGQGKKGLLNRREYIQLGAVATAAVAGAGAGLVGADDNENATFATDFSEYQ